MATVTAVKAAEDKFRHALKNFPQSVWGYSFSSFSPDILDQMKAQTEEVEALKETVQEILTQSTKNLAHTICFIDLLCRLGVSYHFEEEIEKQFDHIFTILPKHLEENDYDLYTLTILFRNLRQNGYAMTSDIFKKFKDGEGEFKKEITNDVKGILSLYEACSLATNGEDILDEALSFTKKHLEIIAENSSPHLQKHIRHALKYPSHRTVERLDTYHYISFYEEEESRNETLLKFAKLDYNRLQFLYREEIAIISRWWNDTNAAEKLPYARDRIIESHMWALGGSVFEPQYSVSRMLFCKYVQLITMVDDTYDSYGTLDELHLLTAAFERLTSDADNELPEYMKFLYKLMWNCFEETEKHSSFKNCYAKEMFKETVRSFMKEAIWQKKRIVPALKDYIENGKASNTYDFLTSGFFLGIPYMGIKEISWVQNDPPIVNGSKLFGRLINDISERKNESKRGDFPKAMDSYMKEHGVSYDEAIEGIQEIIETEWKNMNEDLMNTANDNNNIPKILLKYTFNYARMAQVCYGGTDMFTYASHMKQLNASMFINPFPL